LVALGTKRSYTMVTEPSLWMSGIRPSSSSVSGSVKWMGDQVLPWSSEKLTAPGLVVTALDPEPVVMNRDHTE
jgi:hypothetical protein